MTSRRVASLDGRAALARLRAQAPAGLSSDDALELALAPARDHGGRPMWDVLEDLWRYSRGGPGSGVGFRGGGVPRWLGTPMSLRPEPSTHGPLAALGLG